MYLYAWITQLITYVKETGLINNINSTFIVKNIRDSCLGWFSQSGKRSTAFQIDSCSIQYFNMKMANCSYASILCLVYLSVAAVVGAPVVLRSVRRGLPR